jgi:hypothetical protein
MSGFEVNWGSERQQDFRPASSTEEFKVSSNESGRLSEIHTNPSEDNANGYA